jgi:hypothetical protein
MVYHMAVVYDGWFSAEVHRLTHKCNVKASQISRGIQHAFRPASVTGESF